MGFGPDVMKQSHFMPSNSLAEGSFGTQQPLVSVGIPTYNRPVGLRRTLQHICNQTYSNLEIIVSDNASPGSETEATVREFSAADARIKYFRQPANVGISANFRFVLDNSSGDYFMWAADDDEWDASFIETCLAAAGPSCSAMTNFKTIFRARNFIEENLVPQLSPDASLFQNVQNYFSNMQPSIIYGIHPRRSVLFAFTERYFDFCDCYIVLRIILETDFRTIDKNLYSAGVDAPAYEIKYADQKRKRFRYWRFYWLSCLALIRCSRLSLIERIRLLWKLTQIVADLRAHHERARKKTT
jgi:glycosyltransferase involved in cell wall biosynthesis